MKKISYIELAALILIEVITLNSGININILKEGTGIDSWIAAILSYFIGFITIILVLYIANYKKDLTINEKITSLFGKTFGNIINILISLILFITGITILYNVSSFTTTQFLYRTPIMVSSILLVTLATYNSIKEINVISKVCQILMGINFTLFIISTFSLIGETKLDNFLPILKGNNTNIIITSLKLASINTLPLITILTIPKNKLTVPEKYNKTVILSYLLGCTISILVVIGTFGVLGIHLVNLFEFPHYMVLKKVKLFGFLERIENIVSLQWIIGSYVYLTIIIYSISKSIKTNSKKVFTYTNIIIGILLLITTNLIFKNNTLFNIYKINIFPYIISILLIIYIIITTKIFINNRKCKL